MKKTILLASCFCLLSVVGFSQTKTVLLDYFFNHEDKKSPTGEKERFHYTWEDTAQSGYSKLGEVFTKNGFQLKSLESRPDKKNLKGASVYLIVDPDTEKETDTPNYIMPEHIKAIENWVKKGGVLVVMANDSLNVEFEHLNKLTETFGIHLNKDLKSRVLKDNYEMAAFFIPKNDPIFKTAKKVYLKEVTSLTLSKKAEPILVHHKDKYIVAASAKVGKGTVVVVGDPWLYNEYVNGRLGYKNKWDNDKAMEDLVKFLAEVSK